MALRDGQLIIGTAGVRRQERVLIGLGDPGSQTRVRLRIGVDCQFSTGGFALPLSVTAVLVGAGGEATTIPLACGPVTDLEVARPASGALWLSIVLPPQRGHPQSLPFPGGNGVRIDEIAFQ